MRTPDPALVEALGALLLHRHVGSQAAATWETLMRELKAAGLNVTQPRRLQEARDVLRAKGLPVVGTSDRGVFLASTEDERAEAASEIRKRIASLNRALYSVDAACAGRIQLALALEAGVGAEGRGTP